MALKYTSEDMGTSLSDLLIYEIHAAYSREQVKLSENTNALSKGVVLKVNTDGSYSEFTAAEGESAAAVLAQDVPANSGEAVIFVRGVVLNNAALQWKSDITDANKKAALTSLKNATIIIKE